MEQRHISTAVYARILMWGRVPSVQCTSDLLVDGGCNQLNSEISVVVALYTLSLTETCCQQTGLTGTGSAGLHRWNRIGITTEQKTLFTRFTHHYGYNSIHTNPSIYLLLLPDLRAAGFGWSLSQAAATGRSLGNTLDKQPAHLRATQR